MDKMQKPSNAELLVTVYSFCFSFYSSTYVEHKIIFATQNIYYKRHYFVYLYVIIKDRILHICLLYNQ
jgi:hypothetical protein